MPALASSSIIASLTTPTEVTLDSLFAEYGWSEADVLSALVKLAEIFEELDLEIIPTLKEGGLKDSRVLRRQSLLDPMAALQLDLRQGEGNEIEFKETLILDTKKHILGAKPVSECRSDEVLLAALKTISAFANTRGGILLIGVSDDRAFVPLEREFPLTCPAGNRSFDQWELYLRGKIDQYFEDGKSINASVSVQRVDIEDGTIARLVIGTRRKLAVLNWVDGQRLYVRTGNRTVAVRTSELDSFFELKKLY